MASTPSGRVDTNSEVLVGHLTSLVESLLTPTAPVPFFNIELLSSEELILKARLEATGSPTFSEMETHKQIHLVTAEARAYNMSRVTRQGFYSAAAGEVEAERSNLDVSQFLSSRAIDRRTQSQGGRS